MKLIVIIFIFLVSMYMFSFAKYNWDKNNRMGSIGVVLLTAVSIVFPIIVMYSH